MKILHYGFCSLIMLIIEGFGIQAAAGSTITIFSVCNLCQCQLSINQQSALIVVLVGAAQ